MPRGPGPIVQRRPGASCNLHGGSRGAVQNARAPATAAAGRRRATPSALVAAAPRIGTAIARGRRGHGVRSGPEIVRRPIEPARWDDYVLAILLLVVAGPRLVLALMYDRPLGVEGTLAALFVVLALLLVLPRRR
jgi:hypothetical protein